MARLPGAEQPVHSAYSPGQSELKPVRKGSDTFISSLRGHSTCRFTLEMVTVSLGLSWPAVCEARCAVVLATALDRCSRLSRPNPQNLRRARFVDWDWLPGRTRAPPRPGARRCGHSRSAPGRDRPASPDVESPWLSRPGDSGLRRSESHTWLDTCDSISLVRSQSGGRPPAAGP